MDTHPPPPRGCACASIPAMPTPAQQHPAPTDSHPHQAAPTPATTYGTIADAVWNCDEDTEDDLVTAAWTPRG